MTTLPSSIGTAMEVIQFCNAVHQSGIRRALVVALAADQQPLLRQELVQKIWEEHGVLVSIIESVYELLLNAIFWTVDPLETALTSIPDKVVTWLDALEASQQGIDRWLELCQSQIADAGHPMQQSLL